jgi:glycosyltransferase involved in cell wall biosynthesis
LKVSIITVVFNCQEFIEQCIQSVIAQEYGDVEYIIIDGLSSDNTRLIINKYSDFIDYYLSEPDQGMYDALNKGIARATGDLIGILNADDFLVSPDIITKLVELISIKHADAVYGNLNYVSRNDANLIRRKWLSKPMLRRDFKLGWMPAHPTLFIKKEFYELYGGYALNLGTAADYDLILRFLYKNRLNAIYLNQLVVNMRVGGISNKNLESLLHALVNDYRAMIYNNVPLPVIALIFKKIRKLKQIVWRQTSKQDYQERSGNWTFNIINRVILYPRFVLYEYLNKRIR